MTKTRREFTQEFKREAVALLDSSGRPQMQIAAERGIQPSILRSWRAALNGGAPRSWTPSKAATSIGAPIASPGDQAAEIARLRRELERTRMERDVLEKGHRYLRGDIEMGFRFIQQHASTFLVRLMCRVLTVSAVGYHAWICSSANRERFMIRP